MPDWLEMFRAYWETVDEAEYQRWLESKAAGR